MGPAASQHRDAAREGAVSARVTHRLARGVCGVSARERARDCARLRTVHDGVPINPHGTGDARRTVPTTFISLSHRGVAHYTGRISLFAPQCLRSPRARTARIAINERI